LQPSNPKVPSSKTVMATAKTDAFRKNLLRLKLLPIESFMILHSSLSSLSGSNLNG
jgi:hypothetical protein